MKKIHTVVAVLGIAVAAGAAWWWQNRAPSGAGPTVAREPGAVAGPAGRAGSAASGRPGGPAGPGGPGSPGGPAPVEVARAESVTLSDDVLAVGSLRSRQGVMVRPEVSGRIARLGFADGQRVRRGQLLVQLDDTLQRAQLQQAQAQSSIARTNLQRSRELLAQSFVSQSAVDTNASNLEVADAQVALAQAQLARMKVFAPFDGTAGIGVADVGDYVKDGADIVNLEDLSQLQMEFSLAERYVSRLRTGQPMEVTLDALPGRGFKGRVEALDSQLDADGRSLRVRARVEDAGGVLKPGMFARGRLILGVRQNAVVVPEEALVPLGNKQFLFKAVDAPAGGGAKVSQRLEARIGMRVPGKVEILEGLQPGELVVTAGQTRLLRGDGQALRMIDLARPVPTAGANGGAGPARPAGAGAGTGGPGAGSAGTRPSP